MFWLPLILEMSLSLSTSVFSYLFRLYNFLEFLWFNYNLWKKREIKFNRFKMFYPLFLQIYCRRTQERFTQLLVYSEVKLSLLILPFYYLHAVQISNLRTRYALSILLDDFRNICLGNTIIIFITKQIGWT